MSLAHSADAGWLKCIVFADIRTEGARPAVFAAQLMARHMHSAVYERRQLRGLHMGTNVTCHPLRTSDDRQRGRTGRWAPRVERHPPQRPACCPILAAFRSSSRHRRGHTLLRGTKQDSMAPGVQSCKHCVSHAVSTRSTTNTLCAQGRFVCGLQGVLRIDVLE